MQNIKTCLVCGKEFVIKCGAQKYCTDCAADAHRENARNAYHEKKNRQDYFKKRYEQFKAEQRRQREAEKEKTNKIKLLNEKVCRTCKYHGSTSNLMICDYLLMTGHRRGCPAGDCDKYEKGKGEIKRCGLDLTKHTG